jgi:hypothetical protein
MNKEPWKTGQRVKLINGYYPPEHANPCTNSEYECEGTVTRVKDDLATVKWDNGYINAYPVGPRALHRLFISDFPMRRKYLEKSVMVLNETNPNIAFKKKKEHMGMNNG